MPAVNPMRLRGTKAKFVYGAKIEVESYDVVQDPKTLKGLPAKLVEISPVTPATGLDGEGAFTEIAPPDVFPPGSIMLFETAMEDVDAGLDAFCASGADAVFGALDLVDLNVVLHRAEGEERDATGGEIGAYAVPGMGSLVYCGLEGWMHPLRHIMASNDLGHPLCGHLREGAWAFDYVTSRLQKCIPRLHPTPWIFG
jgi:glycogen debranching enzyme